MKIILAIEISLFFLIAVSCNKTPLDHLEYIGEWYNVTPATEQHVTINSDGTGGYHFNKGGTVAGSGKVKFSKSHFKIGNSNFDIIEPPTQIDTITFGFGRLVSWKMHIKYKEIFTSGEDMQLYR